MNRFFALTSAWLLLFASLMATSPDGALAQDFEAPRLLSNTVVPSDRGWDEYPDVATDGAGNWVAVWQSDENLGGTVGTDGDIFVARSSDDGATWTLPVVLNSNAADDDESDERPRLVTDRAGTWIATWISRGYAPDPTGDPDILFSRSTDNGATWTAVAAINSDAASDSSVDEHMQLATDGAGNWVAVWDSVTYSMSNEQDIYVATSSNGGESWSARMLVHSSQSSDTGYDEYPEVATDGAGQWIAAWRTSGAGTDSDIYYSRSTDFGSTWTAPAALNTNAPSDEGSDSRIRIATDGGVWVATWSSTDTLGDTIDWDADILFARSVDDGANWTSPAAVDTTAATDITQDDFPSIAIDAAGNWAIAWRGTNVNDDAEVFVARSTDDGASWQATEFLNTNAADDDGWDEFPRLASGATGTWVAVWDADSSLEGSIGSDEDILFARSFDSAASWTSPAALNSNATADGGGDSSPRIAMDGAGRAMAVWHSSDDFGAGGDYDQDILFSFTADRGVTWSEPGALQANAATDDATDLWPDIATDGEGTWMVAWSSGDYPDLALLVTVSVDDGQTWSSPRTVRADARSPRIATDGAGAWMLVSAATDGGVSADVSIDAGNTWQGGAIEGSADGAEPELATDGAGTWLVTWHADVEIHTSILVAASTNDGGTWTAPVTVDAGSTDARSSDPSIATDAAGTWVVAWSAANASNDIHARFARSEDGGKTWSAMDDLNTLSMEGTGTDRSPQIATDRLGTWLAIWERRSGDPLEEYDLLIATSTDAAATWTEPVLLNTNGDEDLGQDVEAHLATDAAGSWVVVWASTDRLGGQASAGVGDIFVSAGGVCGDGGLGANETCIADLCNDANPCTEDTWEAGPGCLHAPAWIEPSSCFVAPLASIKIRYSEEPGRSSLSWSWKNGEAFSQADLGGPVIPGYALCVYDTTASVPSLAASLVFSRDRAFWKDRSPRGLQYKSREGAPGGVTKASIKPGDDARTKVTLKAGGANLMLPAPAGSTYFAQNPSVDVQLVHPGGRCWTSSFAVENTGANDESGFSAKTR